MKPLSTVLKILLVFNLVLGNTFCDLSSPRNKIFSHFFRFNPHHYDNYQSLQARWMSFQHFHPLSLIKNSKSGILSKPRRFRRDLPASRAPINSLSPYTQNGQSITQCNGQNNYVCSCGRNPGSLLSNQNAQIKNPCGINCCGKKITVANVPLKSTPSTYHSQALPGSSPTAVKCTPTTGTPLGKGSKKCGCCCCQPCCCQTCCQPCCCQTCCQPCCQQSCCCEPCCCQCCECCECCPCCQTCQCCPCQQCCCCEPCCCQQCCTPCCTSCCTPCCCCCCQQPQQCKCQSGCGGKKQSDEPSADSYDKDEAIDKLADMLHAEMMRGSKNSTKAKGKEKKKDPK